MIGTMMSFSSLYCSTFLMLMGTGLFNTYIGLSLSARAVSEVWIGALISAYYLGLVCGARLGHLLIAKFGHIRTYVAMAAVVVTMVLLQTLVDSVPVWVGFRFVVGLGTVAQYMVLERWLNEQTDNSKRGRVMSLYLVMSNLGTALGQLSITLYPTQDIRPLTFVAICQVLCILPIALTKRSSPAPQPLRPMDITYFFKKIPRAMLILFMSGNIAASFYGLAAVYGAKHGFSTEQTALFVSATVIAGLASQLPMGVLSDKIGRARLLGFNGLVLAGLTFLLWGWVDWPFTVMLLVTIAIGCLQFTLYPTASGFANDSIDSDRRIALAGVIYMTYGVGAGIGPLLAGALMRWGGASMLYVFTSVCAGILVFAARFKRSN